MSASSSEAVAQMAGMGETRTSMFGDLFILTKARLSLMVVFTTAVGFCVGSNGPWIAMPLLYAVLGTSLAAASAAALNQWMEADVDRLMERTRERPLPAGRMKKGSALWLGLLLGVLGVAVLWFNSTQLAAGLAFLTILVYLAAYTPLKRRSAWCTMLGAVSGALPPVIGWAATESSDRSMAYVLFGILFFWQIPHFLAIAWMYKHEYEAAGFVMLKRGDESGLFTAYQALVFSLLLALVAFVPAMLGRMSPFYNVGAGLANAMIAGSCVVFLLERSRGAARRLFFASIVYLPVMLLFLVFTRKIL